MAYGLSAFTKTCRGQTVLRVLRENHPSLIDAADRGTAPIRAVSDKLADILGDRITNGFVGRMIRVQLQPMFRPAGGVSGHARTERNPAPSTFASDRAG